MAETRCITIDFFFTTNESVDHEPIMAPWSSPIMQRFRSVPPNPQESEFYAPYNKLLCTLFPVDTAFTVAPQSYLMSVASGGSVDFLVEYVVFYDENPVFLLQIRAPAKMQLISAREESDDHIRKRIRDLRVFCPLPTLHAVSAFGTRMCFYSATVGCPTAPGRLPSDPELLCDTAPRSRWDCDVLEDEGAILLKEVVNKIRNQCENL